MLPDYIAPEKSENKHLFCFGFGYTASYLSQHLKQFGWQVSGTTTSEEKCVEMEECGVHSYLFDSTQPLCDALQCLSDVTHILISIPPNIRGDLVYDMYEHDLRRLKNLEWVGYLSSTGIYGNRDGGWVGEDDMVAPTSKRGSERFKAENQWLKLFEKYDFPVEIFRLAGIYGPGRSALDSVRMGTARRIEKKGHKFNRIHIDDIVQTLIAAMNKPHAGAIYNVSDDMPVPSHEVIAYACELLGMDVPPVIPYEQVDLAPIVRSFYKENKAIKNDKIKEVLGVELLHADYRDGLRSCLSFEKELDQLIEENATS